MHISRLICFFSNPLVLNIVLNQHLINGPVAGVLGFGIHGFQNILSPACASDTSLM